jgi:hypothetical protein
MFQRPLLSSVSHGAPEASTSRAGGRKIAPAAILATLTGFFGLDQLVLLRFLGVTAPIAYVGEAALLALLCLAVWRCARSDAAIDLSTLLKCLGVATIVLLLGGEGRVFYANVDWQVRDAALHDIVIWPWPFAYSGLGEPSLLRAPIGMYLLPALAGKLAGQAAADWALLAQNSSILAAILALGSMLFATARARRIALVVILLFSGMDTLGVLLTRPWLLLPLTAHIENWAGIQYSSILTLAFWVPQHAIVGWLGAVLYLLWRTGKIPIEGFLVMLPLTALWSPLGVMGTVPFAATASIETIWHRRLTVVGVLVPLAASVLVVASLVYLATDAGHVGWRIAAVTPAIYMAVESTEVLPCIAAILIVARGGRFGWVTFATLFSCLLALPFLQVGQNGDFVMRASIPALAILAMLSADVVAQPHHALARNAMMAILAIGALTPAREIARAVVYRPSPTPHCDVSEAWDQTFSAFPKDTYFGRVSALPAWLRAAHFTAAPPTHLPRCWSTPWMRRRLAA